MIRLVPQYGIPRHIPLLAIVEGFTVAKILNKRQTILE